MELLAVVLIMAILAGIVLGMAGYAGRRSAFAETKADLEVVRNALEEHRVRAGRCLGFPEHADVIMLMTDDMFQVLTNYVDEMNVENAWGEPFRYRVTGRYAYNLWAAGPKGPPDNPDDFSSWNPDDIIR